MKAPQLKLRELNSNLHTYRKRCDGYYQPLLTRKRLEMTRITTATDALAEAAAARNEGRDAYLSGANLRGANLRNAYLRGANLSGANLRNAYLRGANLSGAYLSGASLRGANLSGAYLSGADLSGAYLRGANLRNANLRGANLSGAYLYGALGLTGWLMVGGLPSGEAWYGPTEEGWRVTVGCYRDRTLAELRALVTQDDNWPEARGAEVERRRPSLLALIALCEAHEALYPTALTDYQAGLRKGERVREHLAAERQDVS